MMKSRLAGKIKFKNPLSGILVPSDQKLFVTLVVELCVSRSSRKLTEMDSVEEKKFHSAWLSRILSQVGFSSVGQQLLFKDDLWNHIKLLFMMHPPPRRRREQHCLIANMAMRDG